MARSSGKRVGGSESARVREDERGRVTRYEVLDRGPVQEAGGVRGRDRVAEGLHGSGNRGGGGSLVRGARRAADGETSLGRKGRWHGSSLASSIEGWEIYIQGRWALGGGIRQSEPAARGGAPLASVRNGRAGAHAQAISHLRGSNVRSAVASVRARARVRACAPIANRFTSRIERAFGSGGLGVRARARLSQTDFPLSLARIWPMMPVPPAAGAGETGGNHEAHRTLGRAAGHRPPVLR